MDMETVAHVREALAACGSLSSALRVGLAQRPPWLVVQVVVQDEFTHDVVFAPSPQGELGSPPTAEPGPALVLDCT
jgi:hypothetical protein